MIAIKGMELPIKCSECVFCINQKTNDYGSFGECSLQDRKEVDCLVWSRDSNCPLVEIVTCKDCKHLCCIEDAPKVLVCGKHNCQQVSKNFYCANAERRE